MIVTRTERFRAEQVTDKTFDDANPNPDHIVGVIYDPVRRRATINTDEYGGTMEVEMGCWILVPESGDPMFVMRDKGFRLYYRLVEEGESHE